MAAPEVEQFETYLRESGDPRNLIALDGVFIDGKHHQVADLTFKEQRLVRALVRELAENPELEIEQANNLDVIPALVTVVKRRAEPDYPVERALESNYSTYIKAKGRNGSRAKATS